MITPTLNPQVLHKLEAIRLHDGSDLAYTLITIFLEVTPPLLVAVEAAGNAGDTATMTRLLSRLRGSSGTLGASRFYELCAEFENEQPLDQVAIRRRVRRLREEFLRLETALQAHRQPGDTLMYGT